MNEPMPGVPDPVEARRLLEEGERRNPGAWARHSERVGEAARRIAAVHPDLREDTAESLGLLHDIGRSAGRTGRRHILDGYNHLVRLGYPGAARICLTHSFPVREFDALMGQNDFQPGEERFVRSFIEACEFDEYDRLIMLCDALSLVSGFCLLEKRFIDVALRYGVDSLRPQFWRAGFRLRDHFSQAVGRSVYSLLPGIEEATFRLDPLPS